MCNSASSCNVSSSGWGTGNDSNSTVQAQSKATPWLTLQHAIHTMAGGDTLIIGDGTYTGSSNMVLMWNVPPNGTASAWTIFKAEHDGGVLFDGQGINYPFYSYTNNTEDRYWQFEGLIWGNAPPGNGVVNLARSRYVKFLRCGAFNAGDGNTMVFIADGTDSYVLFEDCYAWGGGRYMFLTGTGSSNIIFRNCVGRPDHINAAAGAGGGPASIFVDYGGSHVQFQNCIGIDADNVVDYKNIDYYNGCFGEATTSGPVDDLAYVNSMCVRSRIGVGDVSQNSDSTNIVWQNNLILDSSPPVDRPSMYLRAVSATVDHCSILSSPAPTNNTFLANDRGQQTVTNTIFENNTGIVYNLMSGAPLIYDYNNYHANSVTPTLAFHDHTFNSIWSVSSNPSGALKYPVRIESGSSLSGIGQNGTDIGANLVYQMGKSGTLWGETGYDLLQDGTNGQAVMKMWPFPNEDIIKTKMAAYNTYGYSGARGFATGTSIDGSPQTLTKYIWEYLGNQIPAEVYGSSGDTTAPASPSALSVR
ncbi:MAG: hypothetical protein QG620_14 [Patescibacteria group bacterium]|nr:hypothetical protein [Patescibacteria group bacterium]